MLVLADHNSTGSVVTLNLIKPHERPAIIIKPTINTKYGRCAQKRPKLKNQFNITIQKEIVHSFTGKTFVQEIVPYVFEY